jgi:hypothetical protein
MVEDQKFIERLIELNGKAADYGLTITESAAREIALSRSAALAENERFEVKSDAVTRLVSAFLETRYIDQEDLAATAGELINLFYHIKNETDNSVSDDDLISEMLEVFVETCFGSMEAMRGRGVEKILRKYNFDDNEIWNDYENINWEDYYDAGNGSWRE